MWSSRPCPERGEGRSVSIGAGHKDRLGLGVRRAGRDVLDNLEPHGLVDRSNRSGNVGAVASSPLGVEVDQS